MVRPEWRGAALAVLACAALVATSCVPKTATVTSAWPVANAERTVPDPKLPAHWPLTGLSAPSSDAISRRPLAVKIENAPEARPQSGLNAADVVYETAVEGGLTRFTCIFQSTLPGLVGPVRSARLSDLWVVPQYRAIFAFSGASVAMDRAVTKAGLASISPDFGASAPFSRLSTRPSPHNYYLSTSAAYAVAEKRGMPVTTSVPRLQFGSMPTTSPPIEEVQVPVTDATRVKWTYSPATDAYLRANNGVAHVDATSGKQVSARNVVVMWAKYTPVGADRLGAPTYDVEMGGKGRASVFRDGQRFDGTWEAGRDAPPHFTLADGTAIRLAAGNTWIEVVPLSARITMK